MNNEIDLTMGERLDDIIKAKNLSYRQLSDDIKEKYNFDISPATISQIVNNEDKGYNYKYFVFLAKYFNVSVDYLLGLTDASTPLKEEEERAKRTTIDYTGLSEENAEFLNKINIGFYGEIYSNFLVFINLFIDEINNEAQVWNSIAFSFTQLKILMSFYKNCLDIPAEQRPEIVNNEIIDETYKYTKNALNSERYELSRFFNKILDKYVVYNGGFSYDDYIKTEKDFYKNIDKIREEAYKYGNNDVSRKEIKELQQ